MFILPLNFLSFSLFSFPITDSVYSEGGIYSGTQQEALALTTDSETEEAQSSISIPSQIPLPANSNASSTDIDTTNSSAFPANDFSVTPLPYKSPTPYPTPTPIINPPESRVISCTNSGGTWRTFPDSCVDSCSNVDRRDLMCLMVLTDSCDCGTGSCWNGSECIGNPAVLPIDIQPTPTVISPINPICGNGICEEGEAEEFSCPPCESDRICPLAPCYLKPGSCPIDCENLTF